MCIESTDEIQFTELSDKLKTFIDTFIKLYTIKQVTPYIHIVVAHTESLLKQHGSIGKFSQQGFEATHKWQKLIYYNATWHDGSIYSHKTKESIKTSSIVQIIQKIYRVHFLYMYNDLKLRSNIIKLLDLKE